MKQTECRRSRLRFSKRLAAVFAVVFAFSFFSTLGAFAASNIFKIENAELTDLSGTATGSITNFDDDSIVGSVTFHQVDEAAKYTITLRNADSVEHTIESITDDNTNPYITYDYDDHVGESVAAGGELVLVVTATYATEVTDVDARAQATNVTFTIKYLDVDEPDEIPVYPDTGSAPGVNDGAKGSIVWLLLSAIGLIICAVVVARNHRKSIKLAAVIIAVVSVAAIAAVAKAATVQTSSFTISTNYGLYDKVVVTYTDANGTEHKEVINYGDTITLPSQSKTGYDFGGWEDANGNPFVSGSTQVASDVVISPVLTPIEFTIDYAPNDGSGSMTPTTCTYDETCNLTTNTFTREGYTFAGWQYSEQNYNDGADVTNLVSTASSLTFTAQWTPIQFTVHYEANGGSNTMSDTTCTYDAGCNLAANLFVREGYTFAGWKYNDTDYANEADIRNLVSTATTATFTAQWTPIQFTIHYEKGLGSGEMADTICTYDETCTLRKNTFTRTGYAFTGWVYDGDQNFADEADVSNFVSTPDTLYFYAQWTPNTFTIHYDANNGTGEMADTTCTYDEGCGLRENAFTREGYNFVNWSYDGGYYSDKAGVTNLLTEGEATFVAQWDPIAYTIVFDANDDGDATGSTASMSMTYDVARSLTANGFARDYHTFEGWNTQADGEGTDYADEAEVNNLTTTDGATITLYAKWEHVPMVCKAATTLHTETCEADGSCSTATVTNFQNVRGGKIEMVDNGETQIKQITYGILPNSTSLKAGDAYDCDVMGNGDYSERFYVLTNDGTNVDMIYYSGYDNGPNISTSVHYGPALEKLPTNQQWTNPNLVPFEDGGITSFPLVEDLISACGISPSNISATGAMDQCIFTLERTTFSKAKVSNVVGPRSGTWAKEYNDKYYRIHSGKDNINLAMTTSNPPTNSDNATRPSIRVPLALIEQVQGEMLTVDFDTQGGDPIDSIEVESGSQIGELPEATGVLDYNFDGWSLTADGENKINNYYVVDAPVTLYAVWTKVNKAARVNGAYYDTLQDAFDAVPTSGVKAVVTVLKDITEEVAITTTAGQNIELDLQEYTVTGKGGTNKLFENYATLMVKNGTIIAKSNQAAINNYDDATLYVTGGTISADGSGSTVKQAIWNNGGTVFISGNPAISTTSGIRAAVHNAESNGATGSVMVITGGTITSNATGSQSGSGGIAVFNEKGSLTIGEKDGYADKTQPVINGSMYGVACKSGYKYNLYDGIITGGAYSIGASETASDTSRSRINEIETDSEIVEEDGGKTIYLQNTTPKYHITFDANGGTASESSRSINQGAAIGELPTVDARAHYTFLGWFTDPENGAQVSAQTTPTEDNLIYYAHWQANSSDEVETFYTPSDAARDYFNNIGTWSQNIDYVPYSTSGYTPSTSMVDFWTSLKNNYEGNHCQNSDIDDVSADFGYKYTSGTVKCDQPKAYDTGVNGKVNVRISDENTKNKDGELVTYTRSDDGTITNMIPGVTYYWESDDDSNIYGYVKAEGERRFITTSSIRNVRDLGGLTTTDGKYVKYGVLMRGEKLRTNSANATDLVSLGITKEYDLRGEGVSDARMSNYVDIRTRNYYFNYTERSDERDYYSDTRNALESLMRDVVAGENIYFHCTYGADRTGTIAWLVETLLDVNYEERVQDYELTTLAGESDRTRIYDHKSNGSFAPTYKFVYMLSFVETKQDVIDWFKAGLTTDEDKAAADTLINQFIAAMLEN